MTPTFSREEIRRITCNPSHPYVQAFCDLHNAYVDLDAERALNAELLAACKASLEGFYSHGDGGNLAVLLRAVIGKAEARNP